MSGRGHPEEQDCGSAGRVFLNIAVITRRIVFVKQDRRWLRTWWLDDNTDADGDAWLMPDMPAQTTAEYPRDHNHGQPDQREIQINSIACDGFFEKWNTGFKVSPAFKFISPPWFMR
jgi:hypothetical protein